MNNEQSKAVLKRTQLSFRGIYSIYDNEEEKSGDISAPGRQKLNDCNYKSEAMSPQTEIRRVVAMQIQHKASHRQNFDTIRGP